MSSIRSVKRFGWSVLSAAVLVASLAGSASAQVAVTGGFDVTNQYSFRGIRQNTSGASLWPYIDLGGTVFTGDGGVKSASVNVGSWNAIHTEVDGNKWYESDFYATLGLGFGGGVTLGTTYTSYTSPGAIDWGHIKELAFKLSVDDSMALGKGALKPYGLVAFELDENQADGGANKGVYVELGIAPGVAAGNASVTFPIKIGLSAKDYYEFATGEDSKFGYFSVAGVVTVPINAHWNVHGGLELQTYGENVKEYNEYGDDGDRPYAGIASIGIGFSF
jgi:hypothetical protein